MNVKFLNPFLEAAYMVLETDVGIKAQRDEISLERSACTADDITVLISMVGQVAGVVFYSMDEQTAISIVSQILGQAFDEFDELAQSGIAELGNVITGRAGQKMSEAGFEVKISTPTIVIGKGTLISTLDFDRLLVPLKTDLGEIHIHLALRESMGNKVAPPPLPFS